MRTFIKTVLVLLTILTLGYVATRYLPKINTACYKDNCYLLEIAVTPEEKARGLQNREHLEKDAGMLFFMSNKSIEKFWMKDMLIPIDMIWLDDLGKVLYIKHAVPPCDYDPCPIYGPNYPTAYVLEINAGEAARVNIREGERIQLDLKNLK